MYAKSQGKLIWRKQHQRTKKWACLDNPEKGTGKIEKKAYFGNEYTLLAGANDIEIIWEWGNNPTKFATSINLPNQLTEGILYL